MKASGMTQQAEGARARLRIVVVVAGHREQVRQTAESLIQIIEQCAEVVGIDFALDVDLQTVDADMVVVFGGDGSILRASHRMGQRQLPILGVNLGKLGFLAAITPEGFADVFPEVCVGHYSIIEHLMFSCTLFRSGQAVQSRLGLNEVAILNGPPYSILNVDLYVDAQWATTYSCDGLIISTPVGSTAHNLSTGGPILRKDIQAFVISAIGPHTLTVRPVVDSADRVYEVVVPAPSEQTAVVVDGQVLATLHPDDRVRVERAAACFRMVEVPEQNYYRTLREKLGWSGYIPR
jgi:NAD+ kinase